MRHITLLLFSILSFNCFSYPVFFECNENHITYSGKIDDNNIFDELMLLSKNQREQKINSWCNGSQECLKDLKFIVEMAGQNYKVAKELFLDKIQKYKTDFEAKNFSTSEIDQLIKLKNGYSSLRACQETKNTLNSKDFVSSDDSYILTPYPYYSNYMYVTGCGGVDTESCNPISKQELDRVVKEAILMGVDPYLVLSFSLMEGGTGEVGQLYLDPIGVMGAMGCSSKQVANGTSSQKALNSYGTSYVVNAQTVKDSKLQKKMAKYFDEFNFEKDDGKSYYCYETKGKSKPSVFTLPQSNSCCMDLGFKTSKDMNDNIKHALTYHFIDKITRNSFKGRKDPAWRVQRYNGYSNLMGAAEGVSPWRAGVNYYKNPAYGYQTMDFIINSLMFNPYISEKVNSVASELDAKWDSILCKGKKNGSYYIDSDYYFNKHKDSSRLESIYDKYKKGYSFNALTSRERKVLIADMDETALSNTKIPDRLPKYKEDRLYDNLSKDLSFGTEGDFDLFEYSTLSKEDWKKEITGKHSLKSIELDAIYDYQIKNKIAEKQYDKTSDLKNSLYNEAQDICQKVEDDDKRNSCYDDASKLENIVYDYSKDQEIQLSAGSALTEFVSKFKALGLERSELDKSEEDRRSDFSNKYSYLQKKSKSLEVAFSTIDKIEPLESAVKRHSSHQKFNDENKKKLEIYYSSITNKFEPYNTNEAYKEYFKSIYKDRNTIQGSSVYPWRKLNQDEISKLVKLYDSYKE